MDGVVNVCGALASLRDAGALRGYTGGVVALLLNHRLIAGNPPGSGRDGGELVDVPPRPPGAGVRASGFGERGDAGVFQEPGRARRMLLTTPRQAMLVHAGSNHSIWHLMVDSSWGIVADLDHAAQTASAISWSDLPCGQPGSSARSRLRKRCRSARFSQAAARVGPQPGWWPQTGGCELNHPP